MLSFKWSRFGLITEGSSKILFLCYAAVTPMPVQSFQESTRRRIEKLRVEILLSILTKKNGLAFSYLSSEQCADEIPPRRSD